MKKGFTLVELLVVLVIIGILVAIILPASLKAIRQANSKKCAANIRTIDTAIQMCYSETQDWNQCKSLSTGSLPNYFPDEDGDGIPDIPTCPFGKIYNIIQDPTTGGYHVKRGDHFDPGDWPNKHK